MSNELIIKNFFLNKTKSQVIHLIPKFLKENPNIVNFLNDLLQKIPEYENFRNIIYSIVFNIELRKCKNCGKFLKFTSPVERNFCSRKCAQQNEDTRTKMSKSISDLYQNEEKASLMNERKIQTSLNHFGVEHPFQSNEVKEKIKQTNLEKYGVECSSSSKIIRDKVKETNLRKYNVSCTFQSNEVKEKAKRTFLEKYGVEHPMLLDSVKEKIRKTCIEKYGVDSYSKTLEFKEHFKKVSLEHFGVEHPYQKDEIKEKIKKTNLARYGVEYPIQLNEIKEKRRENYIQKYGTTSTRLNIGWNTILSWKNYVIPLFSKNDWKGVRDKETIYKWKCSKCGHEFNQRYISSSLFKDVSEYIPRCPICYPIFHGKSYKELELLQFVKKFFPNASNDRKIIYPLEIDILIPEIKLAIEFNGNYYHSLNNSKIVQGVPLGYHLNKTLLCNEKGYRLIHIWEDEWDNNKENIKENLIEIFENRENLQFSDDLIFLDRSWYNLIKLENYDLIDEIDPDIIKRGSFNVENCWVFSLFY